MMYPPDEVHTSFITDHTNYCYRVMPFDLKNAGATYQRLMDKVFHQQIGQNMEVYIDDMVVKTTSATNHATDLAEVFAQIRGHNMHLNPEKFVFGVPPEALHHMMSAWPFSQWGMDILRPFPPAKGQLKFLLVAIDYFTKWIKACPLAKITTKNVQRFTWRSIVCRFRIPHTLSTTQETPYRLTYGANAMILVEFRETSHRRQVFNSEQNARELAADLDFVDELRDEAQIHEEACKLQASRRYNTRVQPRSFRVGDLVWQLLGEAQKDTSDGKLAPTWGGPFRVTEDLENGAY
uniref:Retrovirus-related Pol polyprotein from transposon 17.6 n=1 Tax=Cajanus cajan TaxID=3821 RepID=A0A151RTY6_CAJCA|nr:Retrovirus-related Pol polyprotein from transposon 17.6 [Cajanus cajan]